MKLFNIGVQKSQDTQQEMLHHTTDYTHTHTIFTFLYKKKKINQTAFNWESPHLAH